MDRLHARVGIWTTRFAPAIDVVRGLASIAGYANLNVNVHIVHAVLPAVTQIAMR